MKKIFSVSLKKLFLPVCLALFFTDFLFAQTSDQTSPSALSFYQKGLEFQKKGDFFGAVESFSQALEKKDSYGDAWFHLAQCSYELSEYDLCIEYSDKAQKYLKDWNEILNLKGMALIGQGKLDEARKNFDQVLKFYPNDVNARFGLAELDLFDGSLSHAETVYEDALRREKTSRKALLSLALVSAELGKNEVSERYKRQALSYHSGNAQVHYLAAYLAQGRGDFTEAERRARSAVQIDGDYDKAYELLSQILYEQKRYSEVIDICDFRIGRNRNLSSAWYMKARALEKEGKSNEAINTYLTGLSIFPEDEVMRLAMEQLSSSFLALESPLRSKMSSYHLLRSEEFRKNFEGPSQRYEIQKALAVDPLNLDARQSFASLLYRDKCWELYLDTLKFIEENRSDDSSSDIQTSEDSPKTVKSKQQTDNEDSIEALDSLLSGSLARKWNVNPFYLDKTRWNIGIYYTKDQIQLFHSDAEEIFARAAKDSFTGVPTTSVAVEDEAVSGFAQAYRLSRTSGQDYFVILKVSEMERSLSLDATLYSSRTGRSVSEIHVYRTGNSRAASSLRRFRQSVLDILPIRGKIIGQTQKTILVDLGRSDGISETSEFDVVRQGEIVTADKGKGVTYSEDSKIGTFKVDVLNEELSEGTFFKKGFYDLLNTGDEVILTKAGNERGSEEGSLTSDTRPQSDSRGEAATASAVKSEGESLKDSLKVPGRESPLISIIKTLR